MAEYINDCREHWLSLKRTSVVFPNPRQVHMQGSIALCCCFRGWREVCTVGRALSLQSFVHACSQKAAVDSLPLPHGQRGCQAGSDPARSSHRTETGAATRQGLISNLTQYGRRFGQRPAGLYNTSTNMLRETDKSRSIWCKQDYTGLDSGLLSLSETSKARAERMSQI